jgi:hypothetical protein
VAQICEEWIEQDQGKVAEAEHQGVQAEPGFLGFYRHVDGGILDASPAALMANSSEARWLDDVIQSAGSKGQGVSRTAVSTKLQEILAGINLVG